MMADGEQSLKRQQANKKMQQKLLLVLLASLGTVGTSIALFLASEPHDPTIISFGIIFATLIIYIGLMYRPASRASKEDNRCPHCNGMNQTYARYCQWCGFVLDQRRVR